LSGGVVFLEKKATKATPEIQKK